MKLHHVMLALVWVICAIPTAMAGAPKSVSVPAGDLADGIELLAKQCGVDVIYPSGLLAGRTTQGVNGTLEPMDAF
jgi:hypothetical protein